jgi:thioredoxin-dependent peroxiredoxin
MVYHSKQMIKGLASLIPLFFKKSTTTTMKHLKVGDKAPDFALLNEKNELVKLDDFKGKKIALFFYPADNTPTCTTEACNLRDAYADLQAQGIDVLGISPDSIKKHQGFVKKYGFPYSLLADTEHTMMNDYGVWGLKKFMGKEFDGVHRTTFLVDENSRIINIIEQVKAANHAEQIFASL